MADRLRWGLLSTATINGVVMRAIRDSSRSELLAVASRDGEKAKTYAKTNGIPKAYGSYEALLKDGNVDAVYISVPNALHCEWSVKAAEAGKHILCEKPIVTSMRDFDRVETAAAKCRVVLFEAFMYLHHPQTLKVRELVQSGRLGQLLFIDSWFDYWLPEEDAGNIRLNRTLHGGSFWDVGVYPNSLSIVTAGSGAPVEVYACARNEAGSVDLGSYGQMKFRNGVVAQFSVSMRSPYRVGAQIVGDKGWVFTPDPWKPGLSGKPTQVQFRTFDDKEETFTFEGITPYHYEVRAMEACAIDGKEAVLPLATSREFLKSMLALRESAMKGKPVKVK
jgi:D-xylose 1-dehydrogenase (NADP+, D-xylono-1,5-lactone-forming)